MRTADGDHPRLGPHPRRSCAARSPTGRGEVGVVMTMGALHDGHRELIRVARRRCAVIVVTVFLNPLQFAPGEDLSRYPKTLDADVELCAAEDVDLVFAPSVAEVYPLGDRRRCGCTPGRWARSSRAPPAGALRRRADGGGQAAAPHRRRTSRTSGRRTPSSCC